VACFNWLIGFRRCETEVVIDALRATCPHPGVHVALLAGGDDAAVGQSEKATVVRTESLPVVSRLCLVLDWTGKTAEFDKQCAREFAE